MVRKALHLSVYSAIIVSAFVALCVHWIPFTHVELVLLNLLIITSGYKLLRSI